MDYPAFLTSVWASGGYADRATAEETVRAVLTLLGQRLGVQAARELADRLPAEAAHKVLAEAHEVPRSWDGGEFVRHLARAFGVTEPEATADATAVLTALADLVGGATVNGVLGGLPSDFAALFGRRGDNHPR
jgi:uncharacterized protein (DUF2267 family)